MKKLIFLLLTLVLTACAAQPLIATPSPTQEVELPTQTPAVIVQTVIVTVVPTDKPTEVPTATTVPSATPLPPPTEIPPTLTPAGAQPEATSTSAPVEAASGLVTLDDTLGGGWFTDLTLTAKVLSLRCEASKQITFSVKPSDPAITQADFYYRIQDRSTGAIFDWQGPKRMSMDENGNLILVFSGEDVNQNFRKPNAWLDFQFIGLGKTGSRIGSSEKIVQQLSYTFDCP